MSENEFYLYTKRFIEDKPASRIALKELSKGTEIGIVLDERVECACFFENDKAHCELRAAKNPDVEFRTNNEAVRRLAEIPGDNLADMGIEILREILGGNVSLKLLASPTRILSGGYLGIIRKAGPDFISFLAQHGLSNIWKVIGYIKAMRRG